MLRKLKSLPWCCRKEDCYLYIALDTEKKKVSFSFFSMFTFLLPLLASMMRLLWRICFSVEWLFHSLSLEELLGCMYACYFWAVPFSTCNLIRFQCYPEVVYNFVHNTASLSPPSCPFRRTMSVRTNEKNWETNRRGTTVLYLQRMHFSFLHVLFSLLTVFFFHAYKAYPSWCSACLIRSMYIDLEWCAW